MGYTTSGSPRSSGSDSFSRLSRDLSSSLPPIGPLPVTPRRSARHLALPHDSASLLTPCGRPHLVVGESLSTRTLWDSYPHRRSVLIRRLLEVHGRPDEIFLLETAYQTIALISSGQKKNL